MTRVSRAAVATAIAAFCVLSMVAAGCSAKPAAAPRKETIWRNVGTWSGKDRVQTESWPSDSGAMRVRWTTTNAAADGAFQLTIHSAISGRPMQTIIDEKGNGEGTAYFSDDPRVFFVVVDSKHLDWTFTIEEPVDVIITPK
ncbi:MAG: hypothetical protein U0Q11_08740 [Vicinamibacterales bacterium]